MLKRLIYTVIVLVLIMSCATPEDPVTGNEPENKIEYIKTVETGGYVRDLDGDNNYIVFANDMAGVGVYYYDEDTVKVKYREQSFENIRLARKVKDLDYCVFYSRYGESAGIYLLNMENIDSLYTVFTAKITGQTVSVNDLKIDVDSEGNISPFWSNQNGSNWAVQGGGKMVDIGEYYSWNFESWTRHTCSYDIESFDIDDTYIYVSKGQLGVDVINYETSEVVKTYDTPGEPLNIRLNGDIIYVAARQDGFCGLKKDTGEILFSFDTNGFAQSISFDDKYAVVSSGGGGLYLYDITDSMNVKFIDNFNDLDYCYDAIIKNDKIYAATRKGIVVLKIKD
ncbi:MAG: hypothetical protein JXR48_07225 [Candidatus Delongbacteria bacterium]|nr:hypothetical protein [Candidatus Delongbacteria bacterium]MBN2834743.1 hypothetical protein [Candidatus Delongbacteria bacterium]